MIKKEIKTIIMKIINSVTRYLPISNKVVFISNYGKQYSCNPRAIYEVMVKDRFFDKYKLIWYLKKGGISDGRAIIVRSRLTLLYHLATSRVWIDNCRKDTLLCPPKKHTVYLQTWHGTPLKKIEFDSKLKLSEHYLEMASNDSRAISYLLSYNHFTTQIFPRCFQIRGAVVEIGSPRNDYLINKKTDTSELNSLKAKFNISSKKKIVLFAPTFRGTEEQKKESFSKLGQVIEYFKKREAKYILMVRLHSNDSAALDNLGRGIKNVSNVDDIRELYLVADILITDYSSVFFDYAILNRPMIFFAYDLEQYIENERDLYFNYNDLVPGPIVKNLDELDKKLLLLEAEGSDEYIYKRESFNAIFNNIEDGLASNRAIELLKNSL